MPSYINQYHSILTQYPQVSTSTIKYQPVLPSTDPLPPSTTQYRLLPTQDHHIRVLIFQEPDPGKTDFCTVYPGSCLIVALLQHISQLSFQFSCFCFFSKEYKIRWNHHSKIKSLQKRGIWPPTAVCWRNILLHESWISFNRTTAQPIDKLLFAIWDRDKDIVVITLHHSPFKIKMYSLLYTKSNLNFPQQNVHQIQSQISCSLYLKCRCPILVTFLDDWANKCIQQQFALVLYKKGGIWEVFSLHLLLLVHPFSHQRIFLLLESPGGRIWHFFFKSRVRLMKITQNSDQRSEIKWKLLWAAALLCGKRRGSCIRLENNGTEIRAAKFQER